MIVYVITNKINGKQYVGQTVQRLQNRWKFHLSKASGCLALKAAIEKYGAKSFTIERVDFANSLEELNKKEIAWIEKLNSLAPNGYNLKTGGDRPTYSEESRKKMSESSMGRDAWNKGLTASDPRVASYVRSGEDHHFYGKSSGVKGRKHTEEDRAKWDAANSSRFVKIRCIETGEIFRSITRAAKVLGVNSGNINLHLQGKRTHVGGYTFSKVL